MARYTHRVQAVLTELQYQELAELAEAAGRPVSVMVREAIETTYLRHVAERRRHSALEQLLSLDAPVADWEQMESEIVDGALE
jgi:predicted DNA-binding protein